MVMIVRSQKLAYFSTRKVGTTSVRALLKELAEGEGDFTATRGLPMNRRFLRMTEGMERIAVVRDPVRRFLSGFGNRVGHHGDLAAGLGDRLLIRLAGLDPAPDIEAFTRDFRGYCRWNDKIRRHFRPQRAYLGTDLSVFDRIYRLEALDELAADLSVRAGRRLELPRLQTGGEKLAFESLTEAQQRRVLAITAPDYELLARYYRAPEVGAGVAG
ncbi:sulfotransferase family 2 domain-containing protein [Pseudoroseicyclus sp. CXY001]|uniref:sulfotransferase family 2 domain-containing protein n=1 Tax=Pseudoroseicyclus sp. CXY001 TaxID=3242492 RepID=UPI003570A658